MTGGATGFQNPPLGDMVSTGAVSARSVRIWLRSERPGRVRIETWPDGPDAAATAAEVIVPDAGARDHTAALDLAEALTPNTAYRYRATHEDGHDLGSGRFVTAPSGPADAPERFAIAFLSCHQPFDEDGRPRRRSAAMLHAAAKALDSEQARFAFLMGDQMYTDYPKALSLFDERYFRQVAPPGKTRIEECSPEQSRRIVQARYRQFWNVAGWKELLAQLPCLPILDDHEIADNWGSLECHSAPGWREYGMGARLAYLDYQAARVRDYAHGLPGDFDYAVDWGDVAAYVLDLRSNRSTERVYSPDQEQRLRRFLAERTERSVLLLVLSVPPVHLPRWAAQVIARLGRVGEDFRDRWSADGHVRDRDRLLDILREHQQLCPQQKLAILSGDIHIACAHEIRWNGSGERILQLVASGITHSVSRPAAIVSGLALRAHQLLLTGSGREARVRRLAGEAQLDKNPHHDLNLGLIAFARAPCGARTMRVKVYAHEGDEPRLVYRSPLL